MAELIKLEVVTPTGLVVSEDVEELTACGADGEFGVLPGHCDMLAGMKIGSVSYRASGKTSNLAVGGGYAEVGSDRVIILAETAEKAEDIDRSRAEDARNRAEEKLSGMSHESPDYVVQSEALERANVRLEVAGSL